MDPKDLYMEEHERLIEEYMETHPGATWDEAYDRCGDDAYLAMQDRCADRANNARQRQKDEGL